MKGYWKISSLGWLIVIAMFAVAIMEWSSAPDQIAAHWNGAGQVDGYGGKFAGLLLVPIIATLIWSLLNFGAWRYRRQFDRGVRNAFFLFAYALLLLQGSLFAAQILYVRGFVINVTYIIGPGLVFIFIAVGCLVVFAARKKLRENHVPPFSTPT